MQCACHVELARTVADLAVAAESPVDIQIKTRADALKIQIVFAVRLVRRERNGAAVMSARVFLRNMRRIERKRVFQIGIQRHIVTVPKRDLPAERNGHCLRKRFCGEIIPDVFKRRIVPEIPLPAKAAEKRGLFSVHDPCRRFVGIGNIICTRLFTADVQGRQMFMIWMQNHILVSPLYSNLICGKDPNK